MSPLSLMHLYYSWIEKAPACFMEDNGLKRIAQTRLKVLILGGPAYHLVLWHLSHHVVKYYLD